MEARQIADAEETKSEAQAKLDNELLTFRRCELQRNARAARLRNEEERLHQRAEIIESLVNAEAAFAECGPAQLELIHARSPATGDRSTAAFFASTPGTTVKLLVSQLLENARQQYTRESVKLEELRAALADAEQAVQTVGTRVEALQLKITTS